MRWPGTQRGAARVVATIGPIQRYGRSTQTAHRRLTDESRVRRRALRPTVRLK